jgi:hypothetical protein
MYELLLCGGYERVANFNRRGKVNVETDICSFDEVYFPVIEDNHGYLIRVVKHSEDFNSIKSYDSLYTVDISKTRDILMDYLVQEKAKTWKQHLDRTQWQSVAKECPQKKERTTVVGCFY